jgi:hypothetical protein
MCNDASETFDGARVRCILAERNMSARVIAIGGKSPSSSALTAAASVLSPQMTRCGPRHQTFLRRACRSEAEDLTPKRPLANAHRRLGEPRADAVISLVGERSAQGRPRATFGSGSRPYGLWLFAVTCR